MGCDLRRGAGGRTVPLRPPRPAHRAQARHRHRRSGRRAERGGHHLPPGRRLPGPPPSGARGVYPFPGGGPGPPGFHRQRHRRQPPGGAVRPLRRAGGPGRPRPAGGGGPGKTVPGGRPADSPGPPLRLPPGVFHRTRHRQGHPPVRAAAGAHRPGARPDGADRHPLRGTCSGCPAGIPRRAGGCPAGNSALRWLRPAQRLPLL